VLDDVIHCRKPVDATNPILRSFNAKQVALAVIITIMVLQLKLPEHPTFAALAPLWPTALSYAVSYFLIAIVWVNHHYLLRMADGATPQLIWWNFAHLFLVSLVPVFDSMDCRVTDGSGSSVCIRCVFCAGKYSLFRVRA
jgi:uncharacterized membrane protein